MALFIDVYIDNTLKERYGNVVSTNIIDICKRYELNRYFQVRLYKKIEHEDGCMDNRCILSQIFDKDNYNEDMKIRNQMIMFITNLEEKDVIVCNIIHNKEKYNKKILYKKSCCYDMKKLNKFNIDKIELDGIDINFEDKKGNILIKNENKIFKEMNIFISDKKNIDLC